MSALRVEQCWGQLAVFARIEAQPTQPIHQAGVNADRERKDVFPRLHLPSHRLQLPVRLHGHGTARIGIELGVTRRRCMDPAQGDTEPQQGGEEIQALHRVMSPGTACPFQWHDFPISTLPPWQSIGQMDRSILFGMVVCCEIAPCERRVRSRPHQRQRLRRNGVPSHSPPC
ncbi:hypothetical protein D3C72_1818790 [compost metagenome]